MRLLLDGKIHAITLLDGEELRQTVEEAEKRIADTVQAWLLNTHSSSETPVGNDLRTAFDISTLTYGPC
jgi:hypothetical protein